MLSVYLAAGASFGVGVLRDWLMVAKVPGYAQVFGAMYVVALAASFSVNALTLGQGFHHHRGRLLGLSALALVLFVGLTHFRQPMGTGMFWWVLPVPALYVFGARYARRLLDTGHVLIGRLRDGVTNLVMLLLVVAGFQESSFTLAVVAGTLFPWWAMRRLAPGEPAPTPQAQAMPWREQLAVIFYANVASVMVNAWAMEANAAGGVLFGQPVPLVVRVAVYTFQLFSLPSVLVARWRPASGSWPALRLIAWVGIAVAAAAAFLPLSLSVLLFPPAALFALYASVLLMGQRHSARGVR